MLGTDVRRAGESAGHEIVALTRAELDICEPAAIAGYQPDAIINCAAFTDVDGAETDPRAFEINGRAPGRLATVATQCGAWLLHLSSDYVFAGDSDRPYLESDPTGPESAYGASKLEGEHAVAAVAPDAHTIVRTAWLFGSAGRCFPDTMLRLAAERDELRVVDDQVGCPTFTGHLAKALIEVAERRPLGIVHCAAAGECSWFEFARAVLEEAGVEVPVRPVSTAEFPRPARRPAYSVLRSSRGEAPVLPAWREGLSEYLQARLVTR